jgi:YgiT-type zinc finger domain-containing protein
MVMCNFCGNKNFLEKIVQYIYKRNNRFLFVNNVPCEECAYCGEQYFKSDVIKRIEIDFNEIYINGKKNGKEISAPILEFVS